MSEIRIKNGYRKSFRLGVLFFLLISTAFIASLYLAFKYSKKSIENDFASEKINVFEASVKPYYNFIQNKLPEISYYNGFIDSTAASKFASGVLSKYPFVSKVIFYDTEVKNTSVRDGLNVENLSVGPKAIYQFGSGIVADSIKLFSLDNTRRFKVGDDFNLMAYKLITFVDKLDTSVVPSQEDLLTNFSLSSPNDVRITYLNIPRLEDLKVYKKMIAKKLDPAPVYQQDMLVFQLNPHSLKIINNRERLYESVVVVPITYDPINNLENKLNTEIALPGAFSNFKLYFTSSKEHIKKEVLVYFFPIAIVLFLIYGMLLLVAFLIFRNLRINNKIFELQYDFVNNLTHEFKTPVSVIKIAGYNIRSGSSLSPTELKHYGKILDEEADKLNALINKLLEFTQIENRSIKLNKEEVNIRQFIEDTIDAHQMKYKDFEIDFEVVGFKTFITDPVLLGSLFDNLVENAYKYSKPIKKKLYIGASLEKGSLVFYFKDCGIGIPHSELKNVFKKFFRVQNEYNQTGSVGLGLAFCKELANFMGGDISVESKLGEGSEFKIVLPYIH